MLAMCLLDLGITIKSFMVIHNLSNLHCCLVMYDTLSMEKWWDGLGSTGTSWTESSSIGTLMCKTYDKNICIKINVFICYGLYFNFCFCIYKVNVHISHALLLHECSLVIYLYFILLSNRFNNWTHSLIGRCHNNHCFLCFTSMPHISTKSSLQMGNVFQRQQILWLQWIPLFKQHEMYLNIYTAPDLTMLKILMNLTSSTVYICNICQLDQALLWFQQALSEQHGIPPELRLFLLVA